ncbi:MAG: hypothetical protein RBS48_03155 [Ignavibacteriaceae bacterium]|jgi:hypothetical protein|nr:hypothetical protein [Ignavibacteriaceae bacterium]
MNGTVTEKPRRFDLTNFLLRPILAGILGFVIFLVVLSLTKYLGSLLTTDVVFKIESNDFLLAAIGFVLLSLIEVLKNFRQE